LNGILHISTNNPTCRSSTDFANVQSNAETWNDKAIYFEKNRASPEY